MTSPLRVAQVMGKMAGGGVESVVMNYYRHIDRDRIQFDFLIDEDSTFVPREEIKSLGGRVFVVPPYQEVFRYSRELETLFRSENWSIVHSHVNTLSVFPLRAAKRAGIPVRIAHAHSSSGGGAGEQARDALKSVLRTLANVYPTFRMACGEAAGHWLFGSASFVVLPNAIDFAAFRPNLQTREETRAEMGIREGTFVVGHMGRMAPQKNHRRLLAIFKVLLRLEPDSILLLVGDGPLKRSVAEQASALGIDESVRFLGQRNDAYRLYQAFDVFCLPSVYEGFPVVCVESQGSETPMLASTEVSSEVALTSLLEFEVLSSSDEQWARHLLSMRGRAFLPDEKEKLEKYNIDIAARELERIYESHLDSLCMTEGASL